jgi:hypothetical protein
MQTAGTADRAPGDGAASIVWVEFSEHWLAAHVAIARRERAQHYRDGVRQDTPRTMQRPHRAVRRSMGGGGHSRIACHRLGRRPLPERGDAGVATCSDAPRHPAAKHSTGSVTVVRSEEPTAAIVSGPVPVDRVLPGADPITAPSPVRVPVATMASCPFPSGRCRASAASTGADSHAS